MISRAMGGDGAVRSAASAMPMLVATVLVLAILVAPREASAEPRWDEWERTQEGFEPLFNGEDLDGWVNVNGSPFTYFVRDGMLVTNGKPYGVLRTDRKYENFILELEYRHIEQRGNSGVFIWSDPIPAVGRPFTRSIEVQVLDGRNTENYTSHGDVFSIQGASLVPEDPHPNDWARALPRERRANPAGQWNHYRIIAYDGQVKLAVNGKIVSEAREAVPRKGYICIEAEGAECHFRNIRIRELPSTDPSADQIADPARGFQNLYNGVNLMGWTHEDGYQELWEVDDWILSYVGEHGEADGSGGESAEPKHLWTEQAFGDFELICDWRWTGETVTRELPVIDADGTDATDADGERVYEETTDAGRGGIFLRGSEKAKVDIWSLPVGSGGVNGYRTDASLPPEVRAAVTPDVNADSRIGQWNRFIITMRGDRLTVTLNGETVIEDAYLPDVPAEGPIGLVDGGWPIDFGNVYVRPLD